MNDQGRYIIDNHIRKMRIGERLKISRTTFGEAFGSGIGWPGIYRTAREQLLSNLPGSGWGEYTVDEDVVTGDVIVSRNESLGKRVYVDPDREHLFQRLPDGSLEPKQRKAG